MVSDQSGGNSNAMALISGNNSFLQENQILNNDNGEGLNLRQKPPIPISQLGTLVGNQK